MPDMYADIATADAALQELLVGVLELRASDPQQRAMLDAYLSEIELPMAARALEVGCGTGAVARRIANLASVDEVVGIDPSPVFIAKARELGPAKIRFDEGDGAALPYENEAFDLVIFHTVLCHMPERRTALTEANRVLKSGGQIAVFDGDYITTTVASFEADPLQSNVAAVMASAVDDPWLIRHLRPMLSDAGFKPGPLRSHGYIETEDPQYMLTIVDRGADFLAADRRITSETAAAQKAEARARVAAGTFFGFIGYASIIARKP